MEKYFSGVNKLKCVFRRVVTMQEFVPNYFGTCVSNKYSIDFNPYRCHTAAVK